MTALRVTDLTMDPLQRAAAEAPQGPILVLGGPGTGKTHTIIARTALLLKGGASPHTITCLTYNSRGAEDLRRRMEQVSMIGEDARHIFVGTIHHYASFYLRRAGAAALNISPNFSIWDQQQAIEVISEMLDQDVVEGERTPTAEIAEILDWNKKNQTNTPEESETPRKAQWLEIIERYVQEKRRQNTLDLDDLIPLAVKAMETDPETRAVWNRTRTRHLLIDEFQDVTPRQHQLINLITGSARSIMVVADPNQSINGWRGADPRLMERFQLDHGPDLNIRMLQVNHRGTRTMSNIATVLTRSDQLSGLNDDHQSAIRIEGPRPTLTVCEGKPEEMDRYILDSARRMRQEGYRWEDMACIYRTHRTINRMITQLSSLDIPHTVLGENERSQDSNARCITALMSLALNPMDRKAFTTAVSLEIRSKKRRMNQELAGRIAKLAQENRTHLIHAAEEYIEKLKPGTPAHQGLLYVINGWRELNEMLDDPDTELHSICQRANNLLQKAQRAGTAPIQEPQTFRLLSLSQTTPRMGPETPREFLSRFLELQAAAPQPEHRSPENDDPLAHHQGMTFSTIHSSKGMQWKIVWVADADDQNLPKLYGQGGSDTDLQEEERVFYVASTRSTDQLHFCYSAETDKGHEAKQSRFLDVLDDLLDHLDAGGERKPMPPGAAWRETLPAALQETPKADIEWRETPKAGMTWRDTPEADIEWRETFPAVTEEGETEEEPEEEPEMGD